MLLKRIAGGIASYVPGFNRFRTPGTGGSTSARYCYGVWFRHLLPAAAAGFAGGGVPKSVAELGPGDSLGVGIAALLSGAESYTALDRTVYASSGHNLSVFEEMVELFRARATIPDAAELPDVWPPIEDARFPAHLLTPEAQERALAPARLDTIRDAIRHPDGSRSLLRYVAPWDLGGNVLGESIDFLLSQAVLEHVDDVVATHRTLHSWLRPGALASHTIDFKCHDLDPHWNAHWTYAPLVWTLLQGRRPWRLNRQPCRTHLEACRALGYEVLLERREHRPSAITREQLASPLRGMSDADFETASVTLLLRRR